MLDCNQRVVEIFGLTDKRDYIEHFYDLNPKFQPNGENTRDKLARLMAAALATGHQKFEWMFLTGKGEPLPVETTLVRIPWLDSHRLAAYSSDLRALKLHEHMMREAGNRTKTMEAQPLAPQDAIAAKNRFLAVLSNNIRAPMNAIVGMSGLVRTDSLSPGQLDFFKAAENKTAALIRVLPDSRYQETPIIALTANNGEETQKLLLESSVDDFLAKPIDPIELNLILAKWLPSDMIAAAGTLSREMAGE
jgi:CheY-like chemotaxis protein